MTYKVTLTITEFDNETQAQMAFEALAMAVKDCDELSGHSAQFWVLPEGEQPPEISD